MWFTKFLRGEEMKDEIIVPVQRIFPNCRKYKKCCTDDREFWDRLQERTKIIKYRKKRFRPQPTTVYSDDAPEGFEKW